MLAYRAVLGLTALQKKYGKERLEKVSCVVWHYNAPDRCFIDNLLRHHRENQELPLLDDLGLEPLSNAQCNDLLEIIEDRYGQSSTTVISEFSVDKWHALMENPTTADAILNRLVHNGHGWYSRESQ